MEKIKYWWHAYVEAYAECYRWSCKYAPLAHWFFTFHKETYALRREISYALLQE